MAREQLQTLTEPMYYILLTLHEPRHGYDIMKTIGEMTDGRVRVGAGTLYALLSRFQRASIIQPVGEGTRRKSYTLTDKGKEILQAEHQRLKALVRDGDGVMAVMGKESGCERQTPSGGTTE